MIYSMTGFAALERKTAAGTLLLDLRAVNHRYLEVHMRMDESLRSFEPAMREAIGALLRLVQHLRHTLSRVFQLAA